jgi:hypothetical protein
VRRSAYPRIVNNFVHDMSTGTWAACVLVIWTLWRETASASAETAQALALAEQRVFWLLVAALVGLAVTGALRLAYWRDDTTEETLAPKRSALIVKHVAFVVIYGLGSLWAAWMAFGWGA